MSETLLRELRQLKKELQKECDCQVGENAKGLKTAIHMVDNRIKRIKEWSKY